jgi:opacity protein-like surface antigen
MLAPISKHHFNQLENNTMNKSLNLKNLSLVAIVAMTSLAMGVLQPANAAEQEDGRVRAALDKAGLKFEVTKDKTFKVIIKLNGGRTHVVLIDSDTSKINGTNMEFREVYALAYKVDGELSADLSNKMMKQSHDKKIGAWEIIQGNGTSLAVFTAKVDAGLNDTNLAKIISSVGLVADTMEDEISGKDEF